MVIPGLAWDDDHPLARLPAWRTSDLVRRVRNDSAGGIRRLVGGPTFYQMAERRCDLSSLVGLRQEPSAIRQIVFRHIYLT
jgi:hypothetical protein